MSRMIRSIAVVSCAAVLGACEGGVLYRENIQGNSTGGIIPASLIKGDNAQSLANAHCAQWYNNTAKITYKPTESSGNTVFICEPPAPAKPPATAQPPMPKRPAAR